MSLGMQEEQLNLNILYQSLKYPPPECVCVRVCVRSCVRACMRVCVKLGRAYCTKDIDTFLKTCHIININNINGTSRECV